MTGSSAKPRPNWGTMHLIRGKGASAPRGALREVAPEPVRDVEAELDRLAEQRRPREAWLRGVLDAVPEPEP
jgi:hypothetical protein